MRRGEGRESKGGDAQGLVHTPMFKILKNTLFHRDNGKHFALNITKSVLLDDHSDIFFTIFFAQVRCCCNFILTTVHVTSVLSHTQSLISVLTINILKDGIFFEISFGRYVNFTDILRFYAERMRWKEIPLLECEYRKRCEIYKLKLVSYRLIGSRCGLSIGAKIGEFE